MALAKCLSLHVKFFYVMGKALAGELSCMGTGRNKNLEIKL